MTYERICFVHESFWLLLACSILHESVESIREEGGEPIRSLSASSQEFAVHLSRCYEYERYERLSRKKEKNRHLKMHDEALALY